MVLSSSSMTYLRCQVEPGVFSHERLIRFHNFDGAECTAFVSARVVEAEAVDGLVRVQQASVDAGRVLVALPTEDADRVWVSEASVTTGR